MKSLKGTFVSFSDEAISLRTDDGEKSLERANVMRVSVPGGKRGRNALIGLAIGAGAGLAVGAAINAHLRETIGPHILAELAVPLGGAIGAGAGAGISAAFPGSRTIYPKTSSRTGFVEALPWWGHERLRKRRYEHKSYAGPEYRRSGTIFVSRTP